MIVVDAGGDRLAGKAGSARRHGAAGVAYL